MSVSEVSYRLYQPHTIALEVWGADGEMQDPHSGLYYVPHATLPKNMGRVTARHPSVTEVAVGDVIIFRASAFDEAVTPEETFYIMHTDNIEAVIEGYDA